MRRYFPCFLISMIVVHLSIGQIEEQVIVGGSVVDHESAVPMSYTTVQILNAGDGALVAGGITDDEGGFEVAVPVGTFEVVFDFMGYQQYRSETITLSAEMSRYDMGTIKLVSEASTLGEVVVQAEKSSMELALDKRVFNVGKDIGNAGGSAVEILSNIPSVTVDGEGNVRLRGRDDVRILVDGKPSGLVSFKGSAGLQQLQASLVDKVEVVTNPSARYEAEGMAGIINIVLKKERRQGFNGSFELSGGTPKNLGGAANVNYRQNNFNFFINYGISFRILPAFRTTYQEVFVGDSVFISDQLYDGRHRGFSQNIRGGLDYYFSETSILTASYLFRRSDGNRYTDLRYDDYLFSLNNLLSYTTRIQDEDEVEPNNEYAVSYKKILDGEGHELNVDLRYLDNWEDSDQVFTQYTYAPNGAQVDELIQLSPNDETEKLLLFQADYIYPFSEDGKVEAGARFSWREITNDFSVSEKNEEGEFVPVLAFLNDFTYTEKINGMYGIFANRNGRISYQLGLRGEWTGIETLLERTQELNARKFVNLFPTAHFTYDLVNDHALQLSYSRRVRRPTYRELNPFITYSDNRNFFSGNPDLNPEFSHSLELGHIKYFDRGSMSSALYYRHTKGIVQSIRTVTDEGFSNTNPENLNHEDAVGAEFVMGYKPYDWWKTDLNFNFFHANIDAKHIDGASDVKTTSWFSRVTTRFDVGSNSDIQIRGNYEAPRQIAQGRRLSLFYLDLAASYGFLGQKGTITFNVSDIFNSNKSRVEIGGQNFYAEILSQRVRRQIKLIISYRIDQ